MWPQGYTRWPPDMVKYMPGYKIQEDCTSWRLRSTESTDGDDMLPPNTSPWLKNDFELNAFEFLKSLICLKAELLQRTQLSDTLSPGATLIFSSGRSMLLPDRCCHKQYLPAILLRAHLSFQKNICFSMSARPPWLSLTKSVRQTPNSNHPFQH